MSREVPMPIDDYPDEKLLYADLREKWKHEDELINQRVTWLLQSQGFLLASYGAIAAIIIAASPAGKTPAVKSTVIPLLVIEAALPLIALAVLGFLRAGISAAVRAMRKLKHDLADHQRHGRVWPGIAVDVLQETTDEGASAPLRLAAGLQVLWLVVFFIEAVRLVTTLRPPG
jgi:hypothetical protein